MSRKPVAVLLVGACLALAFFSLGSCASLRLARDEDTASAIARLVNEGRAEELASMCASPFLLDSEIVSLPEDVAAFWKAAVEAGWRMEIGGVDPSVPATAEAWRESERSMELDAFFAGYVDGKASILPMATAEGKRFLLLVRRKMGSLRLLGLAGPF